MPLSNTQLAYTAGIIDGEGCIRINGSIIRVHVTNTRRELITKLKEWFGGYVWGNDSNKYNSNAKASHVWEVSAKQAESFLKLIKPFLFLKAEQASLVLAFQETKAYGRTSPETKQYRAELIASLHELNRRGIV